MSISNCKPCGLTRIASPPQKRDGPFGRPRFKRFAQRSFYPVGRVASSGASRPGATGATLSLFFSAPASARLRPAYASKKSSGTGFESLALSPGFGARLLIRVRFRVYFSTTVTVPFVFVTLVEMNTAFEPDTMYMTLVSGAVPNVTRPFDDTA